MTVSLYFRCWSTRTSWQSTCTDAGIVLNRTTSSVSLLSSTRLYFGPIKRKKNNDKKLKGKLSNSKIHRFH